MFVHNDRVLPRNNDLEIAFESQKFSQESSIQANKIIESQIDFAITKYENKKHSFLSSQFFTNKRAVKALKTAKKDLLVNPFAHVNTKNLPPEIKSTIQYYQKIQADFNKSERAALKTMRTAYKQATENSKPIGEGGFGRVYASKDGNLIFKEIKGASNNAKRVADAVQKETKNNEDLNVGKKRIMSHETTQGVGIKGKDNLTSFKGLFPTENGTTIMVFERVQGEDYDKKLSQLNVNNSMTVEKASEIAGDVASAANGLALVHQGGMVHRDVKPANFIGKKWIDFGISAPIGAKNTGSCTPSYAAPEIFSNKARVAPAADVFSMGVMLLDSFFPNTKFTKAIHFGFYNECLGKDSAITRQLAFNALNNALKTEGSLDKIYDTFRLRPDDSKINLPYSNDQFKYLINMIRDCINPEPTERPTAAQLAYMVEFFQLNLSTGLQEVTLSEPDKGNIKVTNRSDGSVSIKSDYKGKPLTRIAKRVEGHTNSNGQLRLEVTYNLNDYNSIKTLAQFETAHLPQPKAFVS